MKVKIQIEFDVTPDGDEENFTENHAKSAASTAAYEYLALSANDSDVLDIVGVHVDGFGDSYVKIATDHD